MVVARDYSLVSFSSKNQEIVSQFVKDLKRCIKLCNLEQGKKLHEEATTAGLHTNKYIASLLIKLYCNSKCISLARHVFDQLTHPDVVIWNTLILGYVENGNNSKALELFSQMDCTPSTVTYVAALKACTSMGEEKHSNTTGVTLHGQLERLGYISDVAVATTLLDMYTKSNSLERAKHVFDRMHHLDIVAWNILLLGYVNNGESRSVTSLLSSMTSKPDSLTYVAVLKSCGQIAAENLLEKSSCLRRGVSIHRQAVKHGLSSEVFLVNSLIDMYGKCGSVQAGRDVFDKMIRRDVVTWNSLITTYTDNGEFLLALEAFTCMTFDPDSVTFLGAFKACRGLAVKGELDIHFCLEKGISIHKLASKLRFGADLAIRTTLIDMYSKLGSMLHATKVFESSFRRDTVTWNALLLGYVENRESLLAMDLFTCMETQPDPFTYVAAFKATGELDLVKEFRLEKSIGLHKRALECTDKYLCLQNALLDVYCRCGSFHHAREMFESMSHRDVVSWNTLLARYVENGDFSAGMELLIRVDCDPDCLTFVAALKACMGLASETESRKASRLKIGMAIHSQVTYTGFGSDSTVGNTLVEMYGRCGSSTHAKEVFDRMTYRNIVAWNSLILGYVDNCESELALEVFNSMNLEPDTFTYVAALKACGSLSTLLAGRKVHARVCRVGLEQDHLVLNALMDFYIKCGSLTAAERLFNGIASPDLVSWNTLITGCSSAGSFSQVLQLANKLEQSELQMDDVTFTCVLAACSHAGLVKEAKLYFESALEHGVRLRVEHFNCMVDMLGRGNRLQEALDFVHSMTLKPNSVTWMTLLAACRRWNDKHVGQVAFDSLEGDSRDKAAAYVFLRDVYASSPET